MKVGRKVDYLKDQCNEVNYDMDSEVARGQLV